MTKQLSETKLNFSATEQFCSERYGQLASVGSQEEHEELIKVANDKTVWLGGRRRIGGDEWQWLDGHE